MIMHVRHHREILQNIARRVMLQRGLLPDFSTAVLAELGRLHIPVITGNSQADGLTGIYVIFSGHRLTTTTRAIWINLRMLNQFLPAR
jgi:hypothetical protein